MEDFVQVGLSVGEIRIFKLVGVGEEHRWSDNRINLPYLDLVNCF